MMRRGTIADVIAVCAHINGCLCVVGIDGSLFVSSGAGLQRLPITISELVEASPFRTGDNTRYIGMKETTVFLIHKETGW